MKKLSSISRDLIERYQDWYRSFQQEETEFIKVDQLESNVASFYDDIQKSISWNREHLFRKSVIHKILKRRLIYKKENEIADLLIKELIKEGHLPNDKLPKTKIKEVQDIIDKYVFIIGHAPEKGERRTKKQLQNWLLRITACEIEDALAPQKEKALTELMSNAVGKKIELPSDMNEKEKEIQSFIAAQRSLFDSDDDLLTYYLLLKRMPYWKDPSREELIDVTTEIFSIWKDIRKKLNHPLQQRFHEIHKRFSSTFLIISDILDENISSIEKFKKPEWLENKIKETYKQRIKGLKEKLFRTTVLSILGILALRIVLFFTLELPLTSLTLRWPVLLINLLGPVILFLLLTAVISPPKTENQNIITLEIMNVFYGKEEEENYQIKKTSNGIINFTLFIYHFLTFVLFAGLLYFILQQIGLPLLSTLIFIAFASLFSFVTIKMKERVRKLEAAKLRGSLLYNIIKSFSYPIELIEKIITKNHSNYPLIITILGAVIDVPFQSFLELLNQWRYFLMRKI